MSKKRDLSKAQWCEVGRQLQESKEALWQVVLKIQATTRISEADKIWRLMHRIERVQLDLENLAARQHPDWDGFGGVVISALAGQINPDTMERAEQGS